MRIRKNRAILITVFIIMILFFVIKVTNYVGLSTTYTSIENACSLNTKGKQSSYDDNNWYCFNNGSIIKYPVTEIADLSLLGNNIYFQEAKENRIYYNFDIGYVYDIASKSNTEFKANGKKLQFLGIYNDDVFWVIILQLMISPKLKFTN